ncbi:MAG TPA: hypothetical protein VI306_23975 [Pyrinomonadaceae bacterium]
MKSSKQILLMAFVVSALLLIGCSKTTETTNTNTATKTASPAPATTTPSTTASATDIGVPECDEFLKAYEACVKDKVPAAARPTFETGLANWRKAWHDQAANPQTKAALATACKTAHDNSKTSMKAYGCTL